MLRKQLFQTTVCALFMVASAAFVAGEDSASKEAASDRDRSQKAAPILHRRTTLPAGWFKQGEAPGALTDTQVVEARPVGYFDTTGESEKSTSGVADRLRRMRETSVLDNLKTPPATQPSGDVSETAGTNSSGSSRRKNPTRTESSEAVAPQVAKPSESTPERQESATTDATSTAAALPTAPVAPVGENDMPATADDLAVETTDPIPNPENTIAAESTDAESTDADAVTVPGLENLPSVMKEPAIRQDMTGGATTTVSSEPTISVTVEGSQTPTPTAARQEQMTPTPVLETVPEAATDFQTGGPMVLIENESPVLSVVTRGPKTIVVGKPANFVVDLSNRSGVPAKDVNVRVNIPQWVEVAEQNPSQGTTTIQPDDAGNAVLSWKVERLAGGGQEKLLLELVPRGSRPLDLGVTWTFSPARSMTQIQVQEPKLNVSVVGAQDVLFGETKVYTITIANPGTGTAENVVLNLLPLIPGEKTAGVRHLGNVEAGTRRTVEVELTARQTGRLHVRAEATGDGGLLARGHQEVVVRRAALEVAVEGPPMKYAGTRARYAVRVANSGDAPASDVVVAATLPAGAREVSSSDGGSLDPNTGQLQWLVGLLRPGASRVFEMECTLMSPGDNRLDLRAVAAGDLNALGSAVTEVESLADLKLTVNDPQGAVAVGADVNYEIRVTNRGTKAAENIQLYGYFSEGVEPTGVTGWRGQINEGEVVLQTIPRLGAGQEMIIRIAAQADRSGDHVFRAELECNAPETKLAVEEWTRFYGDRAVERQADRRPTPGPTTPTKPLKLQRY